MNKNLRRWGLTNVYSPFHVETPLLPLCKEVVVQLSYLTLISAKMNMVASTP
jgi:hypothetical protein